MSQRLAVDGNIEEHLLADHHDDHRNEKKIQVSSDEEAEQSGDIKKDLPGLLLLLVLYTLQGIPMGLGGSIPFLLQQKNVGYSDQAIFAFVSWPFSLKLLWAPLVDSVYSTSFGRRKSWLVPTQLLTGALMVLISGYIPALLGEGDAAPSVRILTAIFFVLYFMMATQDIAVDGWALTILSKGNVGLASTANSVGQTLGYFVAYVGFLAMNDPKTCNLYFRSEPSDEGLVTLGGFIAFWGWVFLGTTILVWFGKTEVADDEEEEYGIVETYRQLWAVLKLPSVQGLCLVLFTCKMGFAVTDSVTPLKIVEYGLPKEDLAFLSTILVPMGIVFPLIISKYTSGPDPLGLFMLGVLPRCLVGALYMFVVYSTGQAMAPAGSEVPRWLYLLILGSAILHEFSANLMFVSQMSFFNKVSDPRIGGTYMTLLNTIANLGSKWPISIVMFLIDPMTTKGCTKLLLRNTCADSAEMEACKGAGGKCETVRDGYFTISLISIAVAITWFALIQKRVHRLRALSSDKWLVPTSQL